MLEKSRTGQRHGKYDSHGHKNGAAPRSKRYGDLHSSAFRILITAAETEPALGQVLTHRDFFLKASPPNACQHPGLNARAFSPRNHVLIDVCDVAFHSLRGNFGLRFNPDRGSDALAANTRNELAH